MNVDDLTRQLTSPALTSQWDEYLHDQSENNPQAIDARNHVTETRDRCLAVLNDIDDPKDRRLAATHLYLRFRHEWTACNLQLQYQTSRGQMDERLLYETGLLTTLLEALEPVLSERSLSRLSPLFDDPFRLLESPLFSERKMSRSEDGKENEEITALRSAVKSIGSLVNENALDSIVARVMELTSANPGDQEARIVELYSERRTLRKRVSQLEITLDAIARETRHSDYENIVAVIRTQRDEVAAQNRMLRQREADLDIVFRETRRPDINAVIQHLRDTADEAERLQKEVDTLKSNRDRLEVVAGSGLARDIEEQIRRYNDVISEMLRRIAQSASDSSELHSELGDAAPRTIIDKIRELSDENVSLRKHVAAMEEDRELLRKTAGSDDPEQIAKTIRSLTNNAATYGDLANLIGSMESDLTELEN